jgi:hypothetical protein
MHQIFFGEKTFIDVDRLINSFRKLFECVDPALFPAQQHHIKRSDLDLGGSFPQALPK